MRFSLACICLLIIAANSCRGEPDNAPSFRSLAEGLKNATRMHLFSDKFIAISGYTHGVTVIETESGKVLFRKPKIRVVDAAFVNHESKPKLVCGGEEYDPRTESWEGIVWCFEAATGQEVSRLDGLLEEVHRVTVSPSGERIGIICSTSAPTVIFPDRQFVQEVRLWDLKSRTSELLVRGRFEEVGFSRSGDKLTIVDSARDQVMPFGIFERRRDLVEFTISTKKEESRFKIGRYSVLRESDDGRKMVVVTHGKNSRVSVWDKDCGKKIATIGKMVVGIPTIAVSPSSESIACLDEEGNVEVWNINEKRVFLKFKHVCEIADVRFSFDGTGLIALDKQGKLCRYQLVEKKSSTHEGP